MDGVRGQVRVSAWFLVVELIQRRIRMRGGGRDTGGARAKTWPCGTRRAAVLVVVDGGGRH